MKRHKANPSDIFHQIEFLTKSCDKFKYQVDITSRSIRNIYKKSIKQKYIDTEQTEFKDENWKKQFADLKESKKKANTMYLKLKSLTNPDGINKDPIKRQFGRGNLNVPQRSRISVSDISSSIGKLILSENKRKFGELASSNLDTERKNESQKVVNHNLIANSKKKHQDYVKKPLTEFRIYERSKDIPPLALTIRKLTRSKQIFK